MNNVQNKIKGMFLGAIIGDALSAPLDGLSKGHIFSVFKNIDNYADPAPALKGKLQNWRKPGSYASTSQFMLLLALYLSSGKRKANEFLRLIRDLPEIGGHEFGIFRHPDAMMKYLIKKSLPPEDVAPNAYSSPNARLAVLSIPIILTNNDSDENLISNIFSYSLLFNKDINSAVGSIIFNYLLKSLIKNKDNYLQDDLISYMVNKLKLLYEKIETMSAGIFNLGINPDYLLSSFNDHLNIISQLRDIKDIDKAEKIIIEFINAKIKTPVTRPTINYPLAIIPYSLFFSDHYSNNPSEILFRAAECGGTSVLCAFTGALTGALHGCEWIPDVLLDNLLNKKRILNIVDTIIEWQGSDKIISEFIQSEASLTQKELQELNARLKHVKIKKKKPQTQKEFEKKLSSHIVESWTKFDKAKWRKKRDKEI